MSVAVEQQGESGRKGAVMDRQAGRGGRGRAELAALPRNIHGARPRFEEVRGVLDPRDVA